MEGTVEYLQFLEKPDLRQPIWLGAFIGWADAQEGASSAIRYLVERLPATKFAEIDPEEFYDFTSARPVAYNNSKGERALRWPANQFYYWKGKDGAQDLVLFLGTEPSLRWRTYCKTLLTAVADYEIKVVVNLGSLLDALPHTRDPLLSGGGNKEEVKARLQGLRIMGSNYQGPVGITSAFMDACTKLGLDYMSIWAHAPHYVQRSPNLKITRALLGQACRILNIQVPLEDLERRGRMFEAEVTKAIATDVDVSAYVKRLERQYDEAIAKQESQLPEGGVMVEELEKFLKRERPGPGPFSSN